MFEIYVEDDVLFRLTVIERLKEPEDRRFDLINCWLEIKVPCIQLQCICELTPDEIEIFHQNLSDFYDSLLVGTTPLPVKFKPRIGILDAEVIATIDGQGVGFNFRVCPDIEAGSELNAGIYLDQSYFPGLLAGLKEITHIDSE
ncbi:WapI family immunity protein [Yersinia similis]|uniref:Uncharacterized protein n=1 Tax=Yersinia similis TaxID=367190 RepID=A0A0T9P0D7_9GAMM|nr:hypothetical protein [Yersinia similis]AHK21983.1 hypothetical protein BF17_15515 [Yersinia similis]CFQ46268.1 Uncharacterised protein [Yersinia similis]CNB24956.1 Uncharacterised protein [Yersinia similis]CNE12440.1 Uncharacterised protein [Yersinia similis]CNF29393.1 Uncharacterised protein [Yersinia similis]